MSFLASYKRFLSILALIAITMVLFTTCVSRQAEELSPVISLPDGNRLMGAQSCQSCHAGIYDNFIQTAHAKTSAPANKKTILGSFEEGKNVYSINYNDGVVMVENDSGLFQSNFINKKLAKPYKFGVVIGSGTRGQTYLYWSGNRLFQMAVSYFTLTDSWVNSPGNPEDFADFSRPIEKNCLSCHGSYVKLVSEPNAKFEEFDQKQFVYGINCEKCHGAGGRHVDFHTQNPGEKQARFIVNAAKLNQRQQIDACAVCHSGITNEMTSPFGFHTGDTIYHKPQQPSDSLSKPDVHGNQYGLLVKSKCYLESGSITCSTCHNPHNQQRGDNALFSQRCMSCHTPEKNNFCKMAPELGKDNLVSNCIDCHMPTRESEILNVKVFGEAKHKPAVLRTHQIAIYPEDAKRIVTFLQTEGKK